jgi:hypothetical protein
MAPSSAVERGEYQPSSYPTYSQAFDSADGLLTPAVSETSLTSASTATSEPMSRDNTHDMLSRGIDMVRVSSHQHPSLEHNTALFSFNHDTNAYHDVSYSAVDSFPFSSEMKLSLSHDSNTSCHSVASNSHHHHQFVAQSSNTRAQEQLRRLEPKAQQSHDATASAAATNFAHANANNAKYSPEPKLVEHILADGTKVMKAEITRSVRQQPPRKTTFCPHCSDQPQGFHGEHELNRHIDRQHKSIRKVWVCKDISGKGFLDGCKACRNGKTYGANYNAAAHLRRTHFYPCKSKRGGRGKKSEGRGGMGGGNKPSMDELKGWMFAMYEIMVDGKVVDMRPVPKDGEPDMYAGMVMPVPVDVPYAMSEESFDFEYSPTEGYTTPPEGTYVQPEQFIPDMAAPQVFPVMVSQPMQVPAEYYGQVNNYGGMSGQIQGQLIY